MEGESSSSSATTTYSLEEVGNHKNCQSAWVVIKNEIYDVTKFLEEHPGGEEVLLEQAGRDATEAFEDVGHSTDARDMMKKYKIGTLNKEDQKVLQEKQNAMWAEGDESPSSWKNWIVPIALAIAGTLLYRFYMSTATMARKD